MKYNVTYINADTGEVETTMFRHDTMLGALELATAALLDDTKFLKVELVD